MDRIGEMNQILNALSVPAKCMGYRRDRNVATFDLELFDSGRVRQVERSAQEIALKLKSRSLPMIRLATESGIIRLQIVEDSPDPIDFVEKMRSTSYSRPEGILPFYLGESFGNGPIWLDFHQNPHTLIAGCSGSGKSTLLHTIVGNALTFSNINLHIFDTKNVEFGPYEHLERPNVAIETSFSECVTTIRSLWWKMNQRYAMMRDRQLPSGYFSTPDCEHAYELIVIDEFADLIMQDQDGVMYDLICKIAQKGRAAGIHLVIATQRPSVDILKGTLKANLLARISCKVSSRVDSNVILDAPGAQLLAGRGDALVKAGNYDLVRFQSAFANFDSVKEMVNEIFA